MKGLFIAFEGIEGCGKSTQAKMLADYFVKAGRKVVLTREPGGTNLGAEIRRLILHSDSVSPIAELFLFLADRNQHIRETILPVLENGTIVICDRYYHSTLAYQTGGRKIDSETVKSLNAVAMEGVVPDIAFLVDVSVETGFARKKGGNFKLDRIENETRDFHEAIRKAYLGLLQTDPILKRIDGERDLDAIHSEIVGLVEKLKAGEVR